MSVRGVYLDRHNRSRERIPELVCMSLTSPQLPVSPIRDDDESPFIQPYEVAQELQTEAAGNGPALCREVAINRAGDSAFRKKLTADLLLHIAGDPDPKISHREY